MTADDVGVGVTAGAVCEGVDTCMLGVAKNGAGAKNVEGRVKGGGGIVATGAGGVDKKAETRGSGAFDVGEGC